MDKCTPFKASVCLVMGATGVSAAVGISFLVIDSQLPLVAKIIISALAVACGVAAIACGVGATQTDDVP